MTARFVSWTDPRKIAALLSQVAADRPAERRGAVPAMGAILPAGGRGRPAAAIKVPVAPAGGQAGSPGAGQAGSPGAGQGTSVAGQGTSVAGQAPSAAVRAAPAPIPKLVHTSDNPSDRIDMLVVWTLENYRCSGAFVADDNGLTLAAHGITEAHVSIVGPLLSSLVGIRSVPGIDASAGALWLGAQMMSWVEVHTERGGFCLGAVGEEALSPAALTQLKEALADTIRGL